MTAAWWLIPAGLGAWVILGWAVALALGRVIRKREGAKR